MTAKYFGDYKLENNDIFWCEVLMYYKEKVIPLPLLDNSASRRKLHDLLVCPPGTCGGCCNYKRVPISPDDINRLKDYHDKLTKVEVEGKEELELHCEDGCPFMADMACSIYVKRPDVCADFPIQIPRESVMDGQRISQVNYKVKCKPAIDVIRAIMIEACETAPMLLLPDLTLIQRGETLK